MSQGLTGQSEIENQYRERPSDYDEAAPPTLTALDLVLSQAIAGTEAEGSGTHIPQPSPLSAFFSETISTEQAIRLWLGDDPFVLAEESFSEWKTGATRRLSRDIGELDRLLGEQIDAILHHPRFQKLESSWRGINMLVNQVELEASRDILIRVLNVSWKEVDRDFERANEFDNSNLFRKIYENEFGTPGGIPFGVMIGDYQIHARPSSDHPHDDIAVLGQMAGVAAAAFCPFISGVHPSLFGLDDFTSLESTKDIARGFQTAEFTKWRALRAMEDARYVGLTLPRILMRNPYDITYGDGFCYREEVNHSDQSRYLWGNAAFALGTVLIRSFAKTGWLADIRGVERNIDGGGLVTQLPVQYFATDREGIAPKCCTDTIITDRQEAELSRLGFIPLCHCYDTELSAFYSNQSIQTPLKYDDPVATANANISSMLHYMLCVSRFAHFLKVMARDMIGSVNEPEELQLRLDRWIKDYVTPDESARPEIKARRPLRAGEIAVFRDPGKPGSYLCSLNLWPHYQLDDLNASIRLQTTLTGNKMF